MHVAELLRRADGLIAPTLSGELVRQAEMREVSDAREFLLQLAAWKVCHADDVWALRTVFNAHRTPPLWVPLTFSVSERSLHGRGTDDVKGHVDDSTITKCG